MRSNCHVYVCSTNVNKMHVWKNSLSRSSRANSAVALNLNINIAHANIWKTYMFGIFPNDFGSNKKLCNILTYTYTHVYGISCCLAYATTPQRKNNIFGHTKCAFCWFFWRNWTVLKCQDIAESFQKFENL